MFISIIAYPDILLSSLPEKFTRNFWRLLYFLAPDLRETILHTFLHGLKRGKQPSVIQNYVGLLTVVRYLIAIPTKRTMMPFVDTVMG